MCVDAKLFLFVLFLWNQIYLLCILVRAYLLNRKVSPNRISFNTKLKVKFFCFFIKFGIIRTPTSSEHVKINENGQASSSNYCRWPHTVMRHALRMVVSENKSIKRLCMRSFSPFMLHGT